MSKATYIAIFGDRRITAFMHACDVFEKGKIIAGMQKMTMTFKSKSISLKNAGAGITSIKEALEKTDKIVAFVHLLQVESEDKILKNNKKIEPYLNTDVRIISDGEKFTMLHHYLTKLGFKVDLTEDCFIKGLS